MPMPQLQASTSSVQLLMTSQAQDYERRRVDVLLAVLGKAAEDVFASGMVIRLSATPGRAPCICNCCPNNGGDDECDTAVIHTLSLSSPLCCAVLCFPFSHVCCCLRCCSCPVVQRCSDMHPLWTAPRYASCPLTPSWPCIHGQGQGQGQGHKQCSGCRSPCCSACTGPPAACTPSRDACSARNSTTCTNISKTISISTSTLQPLSLLLLSPLPPPPHLCPASGEQCRPGRAGGRRQG